MVKQKKVLQISLLASMLVLVLSVFVIAWGFNSMIPVSAASNATVSGYEAQIKDLEKQEAEIKKKIEDLKNDSSKAMTLKFTLDQQLTLTHDKIEVAEALISELKTQIAETETEIGILNTNIDKQKAIFKDRLRLAYEEGNVNYFVMLFDADGLTDFFNNIERIGSLLDYDSKVIEKYGLQLDEYKETCAKLTEQVTKQTEYKVALEETLKQIEAQRDEVDALMKQLENDKTKYESEISEIKAEAKKLEAELEAYLKKLQEQQNNAYMVEGKLQWPVKEDKPGEMQRYNRITSLFGHRDLSVDGNDVSNHKGIDIGVRYVNLYACGKGKVVMSDYSKSYGYYIIIDHGGGVSTLYAHLSKLGVKYGETVNAGQYIGVSGNSGWSNGPHLHLEIRIDGKPCDPLTIRDKSGKLYLSRPSNLYSAYPDEFQVPKITD